MRETLGNVTILINNAGVVFGKSIADSDDSEILEAFKVNTLAHFWVSFITI